MNTASAEIVTHKHIARVAELLGEFAIVMIRRGIVHDRSKFSPVELEPLQKMQDLIDKEGQAEFGSEEYKRRTALLGPMVDHHRTHNSHHPEHYEARYGGHYEEGQGINGMDLFDLVEMFFDWKAASERSESSSMNMAAALARFNVEPQLSQILMNTAERLGYKV